MIGRATAYRITTEPGFILPYLSKFVNGEIEGLLIYNKGGANGWVHGRLRAPPVRRGAEHIVVLQPKGGAIGQVPGASSDAPTKWCRF